MPPKKLERRTQYTIWYLLAGFALLLLFQWFVAAQRVDQVSYTEFKRLVNEGRIAEVQIGQELLKGFEQAGPAGRRGRVYVTVRVPDERLVETLEQRGVVIAGEYSGGWLRELFVSWVIPIAILLLIWSVIFRRLGASNPVLQFGRNRAKIYAEDRPKVTFADVAGVDEAKEELAEIVEFLKHPEKFRALGARIPKGVLLVGPPGTGKTLLARAVAGEAKVPFFSISGSEFVEMFVGVGASRVRDLFAQASEKSPCIVFIDELDALGKARGVAPLATNDEREQTLNQLLVEMDGFDPRKGVVIMAATNRPEILDPALLRPGRFDRQILVDRPDIEGRRRILEIHARQVKLAPGVDLKVIAQRTPGFVGADLANVVNEAALLAARKGKRAVDMQDFDEAIDRVVAGLRKRRMMSQKEKEVVAYHETGHALVAALTPGADPVHKISIIQRGIAALGYTQQLPTEDRYLMTRQELLARIDVLLGGRVAEELIFGEVSTGAHNDLTRATDIARTMVKEFGMSERLGPVAFDKPRRSPFLVTPELDGRAEYSEETAQAIDREVRAILESSQERVRALLRSHRQTLERVARRLLEQEVIEGTELAAMLEEARPRAAAAAGSGGGTP
ncbi:MAG TPA: ATP-dependent zinc metalloprotease FtsH [Thermodesulfobacteriota bacterium]|nr:ATP-dependent zinc metalloprotease FtsH [Thermodesulfobacteriota bacterium]